MKKLKIEIDYDFCQFEELSEQDQNLIECAKAAIKNSYAKYSHFHVGAALRLHDGRVVIGANQENAAYVPSVQPYLHLNRIILSKQLIH